MNETFISTPSPEPEAPKKNNTTIIIAVVAVVVLCCCCAVLAGAWFFGDQILQAAGVSF